MHSNVTAFATVSGAPAMEPANANANSARMHKNSARWLAIWGIGQGDSVTSIILSVTRHCREMVRELELNLMAPSIISEFRHRPKIPHQITNDTNQQISRSVCLAGRKGHRPLRMGVTFWDQMSIELY